MKHLTKEELLQEIAAGNWTIKGLADKYGVSRDSMKGALTKLGISLKERKPEALIMNNCSASEEDDEWNQLYKDYDLEGSIGTQAQLLIAQCRVKDGMTAAQARQYMKDNFHYQTIEIKFKKKGDK